MNPIIAIIPGLPQIGGIELLAIVLLFFGSRRIPELARGLGSGVREFMKGASVHYEEPGEGEERSSGETRDHEKPS